MNSQHQHSNTGLARINIRRCKNPLPFTRLLYVKDDRRTVEPLELEVSDDLPDVCSQHGQPAISRYPTRSIFYDSKRHARSPHGAIEGQSISPAPISTILVAQWPICDRCADSGRAYRKLGHFLIAVMIANFAALAVLTIFAWVGFVADFSLVQPLVWAFFPGSLPLGMLLAAWLYKRRSEPVKFEAIDSEEFVYVQAHPRFHTALEAGRAT